MRKEVFLEITRSRFEEKYTPEPNTGCWLWIGAMAPGGYGKMRIGGRKVTPTLAHRVSYALHFGPFPDSLDVLHRCDQPVCVNPDHLFLGTQSDNNADRHRKGRTARGTSARGTQAYQSKLTAEEVRLIRSLSGPNRLLAERFGVTRRTIDRVKNRESYRDVW
jgi:hypothetical protein